MLFQPLEGEHFGEIPEVFNEAKERLASHIKHWGYVDTKQEYYALLSSETDIVVSTTDQEFFG